MQPSDFPSHSPYGSSGSPVLEFTVRAVVLGIVLSAIMTAANVYLGLKAGMTVSASIPAAVISMGILRGIMKKGTILENNLVQTIASAGESLAAGIIFTIPGLILTGVWHHFHYWTVSLVALLGGVLGIMFMIPLRRTLIVEEVELKYPEGIACAEVLEAGQKGGADIRNMLFGLILGALVAWFVKGLAVFKETVVYPIRLGKAAAGFGLDVSTALIGVGYIVGFNISVLVFIGGAIAWFVAIPIACVIAWPTKPGTGELLPAIDAVWSIWNTQIRYMGVGAMVIGGLWSIYRMRRGVIKGISDAFGGYRGKQEQEGRVLRTETDMPMRSIVIIAIAMIVGIFILYSIVTQSQTITAKGGISVVTAKKEGDFEAYGQIPLASGNDEWQVEGTVYQELDCAYLLDAGRTEHVEAFTLPLKTGYSIEPAGTPEAGSIVTVTTAGNQVFKGTVTEVKEKSFSLKMSIPKIIQIPSKSVSGQVDAKPGEEVSLTVGKTDYRGKLIAVQEGPLHLLANDSRRFIFTSQEMIAQETNYRFGISLVALIAMVAAGFFFVAVASYISGLVGSSNNPVSGMIICTVLFTSGLLLLFGFTGNLGIIAALGVAGVVCCAAATGADVSQDLKTGWLVKATPAKQQYGQIIGVAASAFLIAPVLAMLHSAYTIGSPSLRAPQAGMFASIVDKIFRHKPFPWGMAIAGACVAVALIVIDEILRKKNSTFRTHVMPVAVGIYLPITLAVPVIFGGLISLVVNKMHGGDSDMRSSVARKGLLFCAGLIAGEAIAGIIIGGLKFRWELPFEVWGKTPVIVPELISIGAVVLIGALILLVSLAGRKKAA
jgi:uncharacterized oligopeptide transporter (OPT) family protein